MSTASKSNSAATGRIELKLHQSLDAGQFYEAHQLYRTLYFRYCAQGKFAPLLDLLYDGARRLLAAARDVGAAQCAASGADLAALYVDVLAKSQTPVDAPTIDRLGALYEAILALSADSDGKSPEEDGTRKSVLEHSQKFVHEAMNWSSDGLAPKTYSSGHPLLHAKFAKVLWACKEYEQARRHLLLSENGRECAAFLVDYHSKRGLIDEADLFLAQAVLQLLCRDQHLCAKDLFSNYTQNHPQFKHKVDAKPPLATPLIDFLYLLLQSIQNHAPVQRYTILIDKYESSLLRDPCYAQYLDKIGQIYFGLPPPTNQNAGQNFLTNLIRDMIKDDDEGDSQDESNIAVEGGRNSTVREASTSRSSNVDGGSAATSGIGLATNVPNRINATSQLDNKVKEENARCTKNQRAKKMHEDELD